jgi:hypothetical protein
MLTLDHCLDRFVEPDGADIWCARHHDHTGNHRGVRAGVIVEWDGLGYVVSRRPAPEELA